MPDRINSRFDPLHPSARRIIRRGMTVIVAIMTVIAVMSPVAVLADPAIKCLQRGLREAGFSPRGVDGIIGPNTQASAARWASRTGTDLPELTSATAPLWCGAVLAADETLPAPEPGTDRYCIWFDEVMNGVWLDPDGRPVLRFRLASGADGAGCYAWLNTADDWQIAETGTQILRVTREDGIRRTGDDVNGIILDTANGQARYLQGGFTTEGVLLP